MKTFKYILLLISVSLLYACSKDENDLYKEERSSLLSSTQIGIYQNGKALLLFDKQAHQYYCNPSQSIPVNSSENPILFHLADCEDIKAEKWYIDGKESKNYIRLETGEHSIQAEITRSDGNKEYIMQYITIQ